MKNFIGQIHDTRKLSRAQIENAEKKIKILLGLNTLEIAQGVPEFYDVTTDDSNIIDFKIDNYDNDKLSLVKYRTVNDEGEWDDAGALLTVLEIRASE